MKHMPFILRLIGVLVLIGMSIYQHTMLGFFGWVSVLVYDIFSEIKEAKDRKYHKKIDQYVEYLENGIKPKTTFLKKDENNN